MSHKIVTKTEALKASPGGWTAYFHSGPGITASRDTTWLNHNLKNITFIYHII